MRVRCIATSVTPRQRERLGRRTYLDLDTNDDLTVGKEYLVFGLKFIADAGRIRTGPYVTLIEEDKLLGWYDLCLFTVTDPRISRFWTLRPGGFAQEEIRMWPASWPERTQRFVGYLAKLEQGDPEVRADFRMMYEQLDTEFTDDNAPSDLQEQW